MRMSLSLFNVLIVGLLLQQACSKKTISPANEVAAIDCPDAGAFVKQVKATNGIVWYSTEKQQYFISVSTGTIDNQDIGFVCNLPDEYKKTGLRVTFGGRYHEFKGEIKRIVGASYYYLTINHLTKTTTP